MLPMLAETADIAKLTKFINDPAWGFEQKVDGWRKMIVVDDGRVHAVNRNGEPADMPPGILRVFADWPGRWVFDGELLDGKFWIHDLPQAGAAISPATPWSMRRAVLDEFWKRRGDISGPAADVDLLPVAFSAEDKADLVERVRAMNGEGVMAKHVNGVYSEGRRSRQVLKFKFRHTVDCVVTRLRVNGKDNIEVAVFKPGDTTPTVIGEVTALAGDGSKIQPGDVIEVTYLYMATANNRLYQPTLPRLRNDKRPDQCTWDQLVFPSKEILL